MLFNSLHFLFFFPIVVTIYFLIPHKHRWVLLLVASYYFYMCWKAQYALILLFSTTVDYFAGILMSETLDKIKRRKFLFASLAVNLGILFIFKYFNFFFPASAFNLLLPIGVSFYTFQSLSYTIEVYRGNIKAEKHFGIFAAYVSFFPQLVAGPISRPGSLLPQFYPEHVFNYDRMRQGLLQMGWGFFKKLVIADRIAVLVDQVYNHPHDYTGIPLILATYAFAIQIYGDFSGYSDIAIGAAKVMGFELMANFRRPYFAKTMVEFWHRWHISLSTWFRDYVYIPLGGNQVNDSRWMWNIVIVFLLSGLWHGANWTFVLWAAFHAALFIVYKVAEPVTRRIPAVIMALITFNLVCFGWIFFRANSINDAWYIAGHLFSHISWKWSGFHMGLGLTEMMCAVIFMAVMLVLQLMEEKRPVFFAVLSKPLYQRWLVYYSLIFTILVFGFFESTKEFIYFRF